MQNNLRIATFGHWFKSLWFGEPSLTPNVTRYVYIPQTRGETLLVVE
jgi:hypothetical protein